MYKGLRNTISKLYNSSEKLVLSRKEKNTIYRFKNSFNNSGFVHIPNFLNNDEINNLKIYSNNIQINSNNELLKTLISSKFIYDNKCKIYKIEKFTYKNNFIRNMVYNDIVPIMEILYDDNVNLIKDKIIWDYPSKYNDKEYDLYLKKKSKIQQEYIKVNNIINNKNRHNLRIINAFIPINNMDNKSGCLNILYNYNDFTYNDLTTGLINIENTNSYLLNSNKKLKWKSIKVEMGDIILFNDIIPYIHNKNNSNEIKCGYFWSFNLSKYGDLYNKYYLHKDYNNFQRNKGIKL